MTNRNEMLKHVADYIGPRITSILEEVTRTCVNCCHFDETKELCRMANKRPPARVIAFGCEKYEDEIPY